MILLNLNDLWWKGEKGEAYSSWNVYIMESMLHIIASINKNFLSFIKYDANSVVLRSTLLTIHLEKSIPLPFTPQTF